MATMSKLHRKVVVDEQGKPMEVILPWEEYLEIVELLGLDLDEAAREDLRQAQHDRKAGMKEAFLDIDEV